MAHVIIHAVGSAGDINPLLLVGNRLKAEGHQVDFLASVYFEEKVRSFGLNFLPLGTMADFESALANPDAWDLQKGFPTVWQLVMSACLQAYEIIEKRAIKGETVLVGTTLALACRLAQEKLGLPLASVHLSPAVILSAFNAPRSATQPLPESTPALLKKLFNSSFEKMILDPTCRPQLNDLRRRLGLAPVSKVISNWIHSPDLVVFAFPDWFAKVQPDWPPASHNTSFPLYRAANDMPLSPQLDEFLSSGPPPLVLTAGTAMAFGKKFFESGLAAAAKTGKRCLIVCSFQNQIPENLPESALSVPYANFELLFKKASLVAHHGGIGTSAMALHTGCPQLVAPNAHDQFDNAMRLEKLGVAAMIRNSKSVSSWLKAIKALESRKTRENCIHYQEKLARQADGSEMILNLLKSTVLAKA